MSTSEAQPQLTTDFPPIIFQDDAMTVINKLAGLIIQKSHTHNQPTLEEMLPADVSGLERGGLVHRLDRDTSGVMVIARTPQAQADLQAQFKSRQVDKTYNALVWGKFPDDHAIIDAPIARHPVLGHKYVAMEGGRPAKTEIWLDKVYRFDSENLSLLRVALHTGRTHQIRVHLSALGYPLFGDPVYGRRKDPKVIRLFLHASQLGFHHPVTGEKLAFEAPLAPDLTNFLTRLKPTDPE